MPAAARRCRHVTTPQLHKMPRRRSLFRVYSAETNVLVAQSLTPRPIAATACEPSLPFRCQHSATSHTGLAWVPRTDKRCRDHAMRGRAFSLASAGRRRGIHSCTATISLSADVALGNQIRPAPLLRHIDSAMWLSGGGSRLFDDGEAADAFCVAASLQLVTSPTAAGLPLTVLDIQPSNPTLRIFTWLSSIGGSSVTFASAVASSHAEPRTFATAQRKFVRVSSRGRPTDWSPEQRSALEAQCAADADMATGLLEQRAPLHPDLPARLPELLRLAVPAPDAPTTRMLTTTVLPHNFGCGGHLDHAALLEWTHDAHVLSPSTDQAGSDAAPTALTASINYVGPCAAYPRPPELADEIEVVRSGSDLVVRKVVDGMVPAVARMVISG